MSLLPLDGSPHEQEREHMAVDSAAAVHDQLQMLQLWTAVLRMYHACHLVLVAQEVGESGGITARAELAK